MAAAETGYWFEVDGEDRVVYETLGELKEGWRSRFGALPGWLAELTDPQEYIAVEVPIPGRGGYIGIEGKEAGDLDAPTPGNWVERGGSGLSIDTLRRLQPGGEENT